MWTSSQNTSWKVQYRLGTVTQHLLKHIIYRDTFTLFWYSQKFETPRNYRFFGETPPYITTAQLKENGRVNSLKVPITCCTCHGGFRPFPEQHTDVDALDLWLLFFVRICFSWTRCVCWGSGSGTKEGWGDLYIIQ